MPRFSVIMPVFDVDTRWLNKSVRSVIDQTCQDWELCIADDGSSKDGIRKMLRAFAGMDSRIHVEFLEGNMGIGLASNRALQIASGEFAAFLDDDDELHPLCLERVSKVLTSDRPPDVVYTDEDKIDTNGNHSGAVIKPDWSPDLFLTHNFLCHLVACRRELVEFVGGFRAGFDGSQDYDLLLRITEVTGEIVHVPEILYHWRAIPGSAASRVDAKPYAFERSKMALRDAMARREIDAVVGDGDEIGRFRVTELSGDR